MEREPIYPQKEHIFQHKERKAEFSRVLFLGSGDDVSNWCEIPESEYLKITNEQIEKEC